MFGAKPRIHLVLLFGWASCCLWGIATPAGADFFDSIQKALDRAGLFQGVQVSGQNTLTLQKNFLDGSESTYEGQRWDTGNFYRQSSVHLEGPVWKEFGFQADLSASGWGPSYSRWVVGYVGNDTALYKGDLHINLQGNEFASFYKSLQGWQLDQRLPNGGLLRTFYSQEKGYTRNETFSGNNTSGPYFLTYTPIIADSLRVKVDEELQELGRDYRVDYQTGELWFEPLTGPPKLIPTTSTISVSYQSSGYSSQTGTLSGARAEMPLLKGRARVGLTLLKQDYPEAGQGDTAAYQEDYYQGSGTTGPFDTNYRPLLADGATVVYQGQTQTIDNALIVLVDNVQQIESVDYDAYRSIGRVIFRRAVPPTALVKIEYYYSLGQPSQAADLDIHAVDLSYRISPHISAITHYAHSQGGSSGTGGNAMATMLSFSQPRLRLSAQYRDMDPTFSYMDTVGFYRQESGINTRMDWRPSQYLSLYDTYSNMKTNSGYSFGYSGYSGGTGFDTMAQGVARPQQSESETSLDVRTKRNALGLRFAHPDWPELQLSRDTMSNRGGSFSNSSYTTDRVQISHSFGRRLSAQASWQGNRQDYGAIEGQATTQPGSYSHQNLLSATYTPSQALSFSANLTTSGSSGSSVSASTTDTSSTSSALQLSARWAPSRRLSLNLDRTSSKSDGGVYSGFYGGGGGYYPPGGGGGYWPGPIAGSVHGWDLYPYEEETEEQARYEDVHTTLSLNYQPMDRLNLNLSLGQRKYLSGGGVGYLTDSDQTTRNLFLTWRLSDTFSLTTGYGTDKLDFLEAGRGAVSNNMYTASLNYQPLHTHWGAGLTVNRQSGASPTYIGFGDRQRFLTVDTSLFDVSAQLNYRLAERSQLYARIGLSDYASGYAAFKKNTADVGWQMDLGSTTRMDFGYRFIRNLAGQPTSPLFGGTAIQGQDYLSNTFKLTVTTSFRGGSGSGGSTFGGPSASMYNPGWRQGTYGGAFGGSYSGTGLATFGGYQPGSSGYDTSGYGGVGSFGSTGYGSGSAGWSTGAYRSSPRQQAGFAAGLGEFEQEKGEERRLPSSPALGWDTGTPPQPSPEPPTGSADYWYWEEGLSRWDLPSPGEWW